jgi:hypothetical protein
MDLALTPKDDWFESLIDECHSILVEFGFISNLNRVRMYHELGKRILQDNSQFERSKIYGQHITQEVARSLGIGERTVQYAVAFAQKYPEIKWDSAELGGLPHGKAITWTKVIKELLPAGEPTPKEEKHCPYCNHILP